MREDENINTDGSPTVNIEIMTNHDQNGTDNNGTEDELKTLKTTSSLEDESLKTKSRGKRDHGSMLGGWIFI